ncbi:NAD(P)-dependent alcohol dehydrogenase [Sphingobium sp. YR768]|uniref:NAD(P)-dependent alcohol dehydrogenase n=1 Tax=Sphingobium sp. YR768 TaxID=1884365 RepID=UPI0008B751B7|nr:NAD(P)-dependent alcohol dehydrogenase [Sphingobium sp. YR768]SER30951.1 aryl-alcohol dehydrogenase [Sphingobium sp. YR768]
MAELEHAHPVRAAVVREKGGEFLLENVRLGAPKPTEVLVRVVASGVCHTDMVVRNQDFTAPLPMILGHEGSGVVEAIGSDVTTIAPGDHVVMTYMSCGLCDTCESGHPAHCEHMGPLNFGGGRLDGTSSATDEHDHPVHDHFFGQSAFAEYALANERNVVRVPKDVPLELLGPLGCGIQTGAGSVLNALKVRAGSSFVAFGTGAVGLSAIMAAKVAGATTIIAVDVNPARLALARELGATHIINSREVDATETVREITGGGADFALEASGRPEVLRQAIDSLGIFGTCGIVGATKEGTEVAFNVNDVMIPGRRIMGIVQGDVVAKTFIPVMIDLYKQGRFPFDRLVRFYDFTDINQAIEDSERGVTIKPILRIQPVA